VLTEVFVVAKSINSLGQIEATVSSVFVALSGPLVESDAVFLSRACACEARDRLEGFFVAQADCDTDQSDDLLAVDSAY
jgi:hypothetical protein